MTHVSRRRFEQLVERALRRVPRRFRDAMANIAIVIEDEPDDELLEEMELGPDDMLYGLYQGTPLTERTWAAGNQLPDRITLYQWPLEADSTDQEDLTVAIAETLIHEIGHYFGLSEEEIEAIEARFWRGEEME
ncbi:MAG: metallopeptidase family protein [Vicinamibacteraceae bacterium]